MNATQTFDLIVLGAGVSGVTLAARMARQGCRVLVLEAEPRVGGCIHSWRPEALAGARFWLELGAHTAYNSYGALLAELEAVGHLDAVEPRTKAGYYFLDTTEEARLRSPLRRLCWLELFWHLPLALLTGRTRNKAVSVQTYYRTLMGRRNYRRLLSPAFAAVLSQPAENYPAGWLFRRKPRRPDVPRKFTYAGGLQGLLETIAGRDRFALRRGQRVVRLEYAEGWFTVQSVGAGEAVTTWQARQVALATPPDVAATLLGGSVTPWLQALAVPLATIPMVDIESMAVVVAKDAVKLPVLAGLIGGNDAYFSAVSRDPVEHPLWRGFTFHFKPGHLAFEEKRSHVARCLGVGVEQLEAVTEKINRLPALTLAHWQQVPALDAQLAGRPLALVGNYLNGLSIGDCAERAQAEATRLLAQSTQI